MRAKDDGFPSSLLLVLHRESGVVAQNLGVPFDEGVERPGVRTGVVAGPARSNVG